MRAADQAAQRPAPAEAVRLTELAARAVSEDRTATARERQQIAQALVLTQQRAGQEQAAWRTMIQTTTAALDAADPVTGARSPFPSRVTPCGGGGSTKPSTRQHVLFRRLLTELPDDHPVLQARRAGHACRRRCRITRHTPMPRSISANRPCTRYGPQLAPRKNWPGSYRRGTSCSIARNTCASVWTPQRNW